jgi:hypothetical protein
MQFAPLISDCSGIGKYSMVRWKECHPGSSWVASEVADWQPHFASHACSFSGGTVIGDLAPHEAFPIGGTNSVRGYDEGSVGSGRSCIVASGEISVPLVSTCIMLVFSKSHTLSRTNVIQMIAQWISERRPK